MALPQRNNAPSPVSPSSGIGGIGGTAANDNKIASQFYGSKNRARKQQQEYRKDPNEADRIELENIEAEMKQDELNSSVTARDLGNGSIGLELKFDAPLSPEKSQKLQQWKAGRKKFRPSPQKLVAPQSPTLPTEKDVELSPVTDNGDEESDELGEDLFDDEAYDPYPLEDSEKSSVATESLDSSSTEQANPDDAQQAAEEAEKEQQKIQTEAEVQKKVQQEQTSKEEGQKKEMQNQQEQKKAEQQMAEAAQNAAAQEQQHMSRVSKLEQKKRKLDDRMNSLKKQKIMYTLALWVAEGIKAFIDAIQSVTKWLAGVCMSLAWTIILGVVGVALYLIYGLLFIPESALRFTIARIKSKLKSIDEDMKKTKQNQQKAISMIQSLQRRKRLGIANLNPAKFKRPPSAPQATT